MLPLGEILSARGLISPSQLFHALTIQSRTKSRLGDILVAEGMIGYLPLYRTLAEHFSLPFINLLEQPPDTNLLSEDKAEEYVQLRLIPWRRDNERIIIATAELTDSARAWAQQHFGEAHDFAITSPLDIRKTVESHFGLALEEKSCLSLWQQNPRISARHTVSPRAKLFLYMALLTTITAISYWPMQCATLLIAFCCIAYCATMLIKTLIFAEGTGRPPPPDWKKLLASLDEASLPTYTILVPMYKEAASLPRLLKSMLAIDYPAEKLDIKLVLEADDQETLKAALAQNPRQQFEIIRVPPSSLRTKPKACNYALRFARGDYITIYDADDRPDPLQLKKAVAYFRTQDPSVACLQARLNYYNPNDNWLTRFFALEYTTLFDVLLYGLQRLNIPLPLGGTSNHMSLARLRALGEWDPFNVTEDADLGVRLAAQGYRTAMLDSYTLEEAPSQVIPWIRQRSRWIKGYMQTWLVHMRAPVNLYCALGPRSFFGFQFFVGLSSFTFLTGPLVWALSLLWWLAPPATSIPEWLLWLTGINILLNVTTHWYMMFYALKWHVRATPATIAAAICYPLYLFLHSVASYKALWQLFVKPHFWEKTTHGLAREFATATPQEIPLTAAA